LREKNPSSFYDLANAGILRRPDKIGTPQDDILGDLSASFQEVKVEYRTLPKTGLKVSRLSFGTMTFGAQTDPATAQRMVECCLDAGINFFDTANVYNRGAAETILGKALRGRRDKVVLASKVRGKMGDAPDDEGLSPAAIAKAIDASLNRLGTDYVDLYYLHQPDYAVPIEETLDTMQELVRAGKVRFPAVSNYAAWQGVRNSGDLRRAWLPALFYFAAHVQLAGARHRGGIPAVLPALRRRRRSLQSARGRAADRQALT
jgi:aryl-alcohol dehydrogenase-like predicted oxidoreductase